MQCKQCPLIDHALCHRRVVLNIAPSGDDACCGHVEALVECLQDPDKLAQFLLGVAAESRKKG